MRRVLPRGEEVKLIRLFSSLVVGPHPDHLDGMLVGEHLIHQAVLDGDASRASRQGGQDVDPLRVRRTSGSA